MFTDKNLPNIFTCLNLLCGCIAIVSIFHGNVIMLASMVFLAAMFDFMDGLTARTLNAYSDFGKQLDSLADMVTFGVVPGMVLYKLIITHNSDAADSSDILLGVFKYFPFIIPVFAAIRLARFNVNKNQSNSFIGLPTPAMGILVTSFPLIVKYDHWNVSSLLIQPFFIITISLVLSLLMVSRVHLFALKFNSLKWNDNKIQFIFVIVSIILFSIFIFTAIPMIIFLYIVLSVINNFILNRVSV